MKTKLLSALLAISLLFFFAGSSFAMEKGNNRKGKYHYRKVYKSCFQRGEVESPKPPVNPDAQTQAGWEKIFDSKEFDLFGCKEEWATLNDSKLSDIYTYLHDHAADSPSPAKCE